MVPRGLIISGPRHQYSSEVFQEVGYFEYLYMVPRGGAE